MPNPNSGVSTEIHSLETETWKMNNGDRIQQLVDQIRNLTPEEREQLAQKLTPEERERLAHKLLKKNLEDSLSVAGFQGGVQVEGGIQIESTFAIINQGDTSTLASLVEAIATRIRNTSDEGKNG